MKRIRKYMHVILLFVILSLTVGCNRTSSMAIPQNFTVEDIKGPDIIQEYSTVKFKVTVQSEAELHYQWTVEPESAGYFVGGDKAIAYFSSAGITSDTTITASVTVSSDAKTPPVSISMDSKIIDHPNDWTRTWGGVLRDMVYGVTVDSEDNIIATGYFMNSFEIVGKNGIEKYITNGREDAFLAKFDPRGELQWLRTWGGPDIEAGNLVAVDSEENIIVAGWSMGNVDFDPGPGQDKHPFYGNNDIFVSKFTSDGDFLWAKTLGGKGWDTVHGLAVDAHDNIYVGEEFFFTIDLDPGPGVDSHTSFGGPDAALNKFSPNGEFLLGYQWGSTGGDGNDGIAFDDAGNYFISGDIACTVDVDPGPNVNTLTSKGDRDFFISKFDSNDQFLWARTFGAPGVTWDKGLDVAVNPNGDAYVTGLFEGVMEINDLNTTIASNGGHDVFLAKYDTDGGLAWVRSWGGTGQDFGFDVLISDSDKLYVTGKFAETVDFDPGAPVYEATSNGNTDIFLVEFDMDGNMVSAITIGGTEEDIARSAEVDSLGNIYLGGSFEGAMDFDPSSHIDWRGSFGKSDAMLKKLPG